MKGKSRDFHERKRSLEAEISRITCFYWLFSDFAPQFQLIPGSDLMSSRPMYDPYLDNLKSPLIRDESDGKTLRLRYNLDND